MLALAVPPLFAVSVKAKKELPKTFEEYCRDENLPADQRAFVDAVLRDIVTVDCADPQRFVDAYGSLSISAGRLTTISPIAGLKGLKTFLIKSNKIRDLTPLLHHPELDTLWVVDNLVEDITPLAQLTNLSHLKLDGNRITDISPLAGLEKLTKLRLLQNYITDYSALGNLKALEKLSIGYPSASRFDRCVYPRAVTTGLKESLPALTQLRELQANSLDLASGTPLAAMVDLEILHLDCNRIANADFLGDLPQLTSVSLSFNPLQNINLTKTHDNLAVLLLRGAGLARLGFLERLPNVHYLDISHNDVRDASPIGQLVQLTTLKANSNQIANVDFLAELAALTRLELQDNALAAFPFAKASPEVLRLYLSGNDLSHIEGIEQLPQLIELALAGNPIADISPMAKLPRDQLTMLDLSAAAITDLSPLAGINLYGLLLNDSKISSLASLPDFPSLDILGMNNTGLRSIKGLHDRFGSLFGLFLSGNPITDLQELRHYRNLGYLELAGIKAGSLTALSHFQLISHLDVSAMGLTSLEPLRGIAGIKTLRLNDNAIADLSPLESGHLYLSQLELANNEITSIKALASKKDLRQLFQLNLAGNPLGTTTAKTPANCPTDVWSRAVSDWCRQTSAEPLPRVSGRQWVQELFGDMRK